MTLLKIKTALIELYKRPQALMLVVVVSVAAFGILFSITRTTISIGNDSFSGNEIEPERLIGSEESIIARILQQNIAQANPTTSPTETPSSNDGAAAVCDKFGVNLLTEPLQSDNYGKILEWGMKYYLHTLQGPVHSGVASEALKTSGLTGVYRYCYGDTNQGSDGRVDGERGLPPDCEIKVGTAGITDACSAGRAAGNATLEIADKVPGTKFVAAPLNEINSESWFLGNVNTPMMDRFTKAADFHRCFAEVVRRSDHAANIVISGPTYNIFADGGAIFTEGHQKFVDAGGDDHVDMWTFNVYSGIPTQPESNVMAAIDLAGRVFTDSKPWGINEMGNFMKDYSMLAEEVRAIAENGRIVFALFFNAFGQGGDRTLPDGTPWSNLELDDNAIAQIFGPLGACNIRELPQPKDLSIAAQVDPQTAEHLELPTHWTMRSCEVQPKTVNGLLLQSSDTERQALSPNGKLQVWLDLNSCDPNHPTGFQTNSADSKPYQQICADEKNWTAGFAYTGGMREFPLISFLATSEKTDANPYTPYCKTLSFRNITHPYYLYQKTNGTQSPFELFFTSEFPGLARFIRTNESSAVNIKTPLLGGASACGILSWNEVVSDPIDTFDMRIHPLSTQNLKNAGGATLAPENINDNVLVSFLKKLFSFFSQGANVEGETIPDEIYCSRIPGKGINSFRQLDGKSMKFVNDDTSGPYEYLIEDDWNYEITENQLCDAQFGIAVQVQENDRQVQIKTTGARCQLPDQNDRLREYYDLPGGESYPDAITAGFVSRVSRQAPGSSYSVSFCPGDTVPWSGEVIPFVDICGVQTTCSTSIDSIYRACRGLNKQVDSVGGDPHMRWVRNGYQATDLIGLSRYLYLVYQLERINSPYKIIHNVNSGLTTEWGLRVYDLQMTQSKSDYTKNNRSAYDPAKRLEGDLLAEVLKYNLKLFENPDSDFDIENIPDHYLREYISNLSEPEKYLPVYEGDYRLAKFIDPLGEEKDVSAVDLYYYYPWLGQIPRMLERISVFLTNVDTYDTGKSFKNVREAQCGSLNLRNTETGKIIIDFCDCDCPDGSPKGQCDCIARDQSEVDPLEEWLFADRTTDPLTSGGGFKQPRTSNFVPGINQCINPATDGKPAPQVNLEDFGSPLVAAKGSIVLTQCFGATDSQTVYNTCVNQFRNGGYQISGGYTGPTNYNYPELGKYHNGADLVTINNSDPSIVAVADGTVVDKVDNCPAQGSVGSTCGSGYGNYIKIKHVLTDGSSVYSLYAHLATVESGVKLNSTITKGTKLGIMGTSGNSTGRHLHFTLYKETAAGGRDYIDPATILLSATGSASPIDPVSPADECCSLIPGSGDDFTSLVQKAVNFINSQGGGSRIPWYIPWTIFNFETRHRCVDTYAEWYRGRVTVQTIKSDAPDYTIFADTCGGDPNQLTLWADAHPVDTYGKGLGQHMPERFKRIVDNRPLWSRSGDRDNTRELLEACMDFLGVDRSRGQEIPGQVGGTYYDNVADPALRDYYKNNFSRHRIGDVICATAIDLGEAARFQRNFYDGVAYPDYIPAESWTANDMVYAGRAWYYNRASCNGKAYCENVAILGTWARDNLTDATVIECLVEEEPGTDIETPITGRAPGTTCPMTSPAGHSCFQGPYGWFTHFQNRGLPIDLNPWPINSDSDPNPDLSDAKLRVVAPEAGRILRRYDGGYGDIIILQGRSGIKYHIQHLAVNRRVPEAAEGKEVNVGQLIGYVTINKSDKDGNFKGGVYSVNNAHIHILANYTHNGVEMDVDPYLLYGQLLGCNAAAPPSTATGSSHVSTFAHSWNASSNLATAADGKRYCYGASGILNDNDFSRKAKKPTVPNEVICQLFGSSCAEMGQ